MNTTGTGQTLTLFRPDEDTVDEPPAPPSPTPRPTPRPGLLPAQARLVVTNGPDMTDPQRRPLLLLVVHCPYCDAQHIHPAGHAGAVRLCPRHSRCIGQPGGAYYFPAVQQ